MWPQKHRKDHNTKYLKRSLRFYILHQGHKPSNKAKIDITLQDQHFKTGSPFRRTFQPWSARGILNGAPGSGSVFFFFFFSGGERGAVGVVQFFFVKHAACRLSFRFLLGFFWFFGWFFFGFLFFGWVSLGFWVFIVLGFFFCCFFIAYWVSQRNILYIHEI